MPIKLDLEAQMEKDKARPAPRKRKATLDAPRTGSNSAVRRSKGRPAGPPAKTRSLRIRTDINTRLEEAQAQTGLSYNELVNRALDAYLK